MNRDSEIEPEAENPGTNDEIKRAVKQQGEVSPEDYPDKAKGAEGPHKD